MVLPTYLPQATQRREIAAENVSLAPVRVCMKSKKQRGKERVLGRALGFAFAQSRAVCVQNRYLPLLPLLPDLKFVRSNTL